MIESITFNKAIHNMATTCALCRATKKCKATFDITFCYNCKHCIGRYINTAPIDLELYMYQVDSEVKDVIKAKHRHNWAAVRGILLMLLITGTVLGFFYWSLTSLHKPIIRNAGSPERTIQQPSTHQKIEATLWKVANNLYDVNGNGEANCEDAAILFYQYYPDKNEVMIYANDAINHAFNLVLVNDVWRAVEPQAYLKGWEKSHTYYMRDIWGSQYDHTQNINAWDDYGKYVK